VFLEGGKEVDGVEVVGPLRRAVKNLQRSTHSEAVRRCGGSADRCRHRGLSRSRPIPMPRHHADSLGRPPRADIGGMRA